MSFKRLLPLAVLALLASQLLPAQDETRLLRFPAIHGNQIVFTYAGNLYTVTSSGGVARRMTDGTGFEMFARFSPDGKTIAFTGQYDGNTEVYAMPAGEECLAVSRSRRRSAGTTSPTGWVRTTSS